MRERGDARSRHEVSDSVEQREQDYEEKHDQLDKSASDIETIRDTLAELNRSGTSEGVAEVEAPIEQAETDTESEFEAEDAALDESQQEGSAEQEELDGRADATEADGERVRDATARLHGDGQAERLREAEAAVREDLDFLQQRVHELAEAARASERVQAEHRQRVARGRN